jgi:hypothetical protein
VTNVFDLADTPDLPERLRLTLQCEKHDRIERQLLTPYRIAGRPLNHDEVIVGYYRRLAILNRRVLMNKAYQTSLPPAPSVVAVAGAKGLKITAGP